MQHPDESKHGPPSAADIVPFDHRTSTTTPAPDTTNTPPSKQPPSDHRTSTTTPTPDATNTPPSKQQQASSSSDRPVPDGPPPSFSKIFSVSRPEWPALFVALLFMLFSEVGSMANPLILAAAYDAVVSPTLTTDQKMDVVTATMAIVIVIHFTAVFGQFVRSAIIGVSGERVVARLRNKTFQRILDMEIAFFDKRKSGELVSRLGSDATVLQFATTSALPEAVLGVLRIITSLVMMLMISADLTGIVIAAAAVIVLTALPFGAWIAKISKRYQDALGDAQTVSTEALAGIRTVRSFVAEDVVAARFKDSIGDPNAAPCCGPARGCLCWCPPRGEKSTYAYGLQKAVGGSAFGTFAFGLAFGAMYVALYFGFRFIIKGDLTFGELTAFQAYIMQIGFGIAGFVGHIIKIMEARGASHRIFEILAREPTIPRKLLKTEVKKQHHAAKENASVVDVDDPAAPAPASVAVTILEDAKTGATQMQGDVKFVDVGFAYPSRPKQMVLNAFSLHVPPNSVAALVGTSGAGKSTVVALLSRFYDVSRGSVQVDGQDIRSMDPAWLRRNMAVVSQEPTLFGLSIRDNVTFGVTDRPVTDAEVEAACRQANAHDFITQFPEGYATLVGERGVKLSGGQKQRIAIARALIIDPKILCLDEATSALDAESEHVVQEAISRLMKGRTTIVIAHRLSTIRQAELLKRCRRYQDLIKRQTDAGAAAAATP